MRIAYFDCEDAEKWAGHEVSVPRLLFPGAEITHFRCYASQLPPLERLGEFAGVLISGSHYSAYEDRPWIHQLAAWLRRAVVQHPRVRFVAMCFGCQLLAAALGGHAGRNPDGGFVLGVEQVQLAPLLRHSKALQLAAADVAAAPAEDEPGSSGGSSSGGTDPPSAVRLLQSHGDRVLQLPPGARLLASSPTAPVEMWTNATGNVLAGHAELTRGEVLELIYPAITAAGRLTTEEAAESRRSLEQDPLDSHVLRCLFRRFVEVGLPEAAAPAAAGGEAAAAGAGGNASLRQ